MIERAFWPTTLTEWLVVLGVIAGAVGAVYQWVRKPIFHTINKVGKRLDDHILSATVIDAEFRTRADALERKNELSQLNYDNLIERIVGIRREVQTIKDMVQAGAVSREKELGEINTQLRGIKTMLEERTTSRTAK